MVELSSKNNTSRLFQFITTQEGAELSGYTSDYVAKLARDGEVIAQKIDGAWLIDADSLKLYALEAESRKRAQAEGLRQEQKKETLTQVHKIRHSVKEASFRDADYLLALQAGAVSACVALGIFVLSHSAPAVSALASIAEREDREYGNFTQSALLMSAADIFDFKWWWLFQYESKVTGELKVPAPKAPLVARTAPQVSPEGAVVLDEFDALVFSDSVHMRFFDGRQGTITPQFKEANYEEYPFVLADGSRAKAGRK